MFITLLLVLLEAGLAILFPLFIGYAINGAIAHDYTGAYWLGGLGLLSLVIGSTRRLVDSRFYARVFRKFGHDIGSTNQLTPTRQNAMLSMLEEMVGFFENSIPEIVSSLIGLVGTLIIVSTLNTDIFIGCLIVLAVVFIVYALTRKRTMRYNTAYNDMLEEQVEVLQQKDGPKLHSFLRKLMKWNIKLSDLETINFSVVWLVMMALLVVSIVKSVQGGDVDYGSVFALVMYVFQYIESVTVLPFFYQQWLRLREISDRLSSALRESVQI